MASAGNGNPTHLAGELLKAVAKIDMTHVPYRGAAPAISDLLGGQVQVYLGSLPATIEHIRAGKLRALAVTTSTRFEGIARYPNCERFRTGLRGEPVVRRRVTQEDVQPRLSTRLNKEINIALADAKMKARLADLGTTVFPGSAADLGKFVAEETEKWGAVVKSSGAKPD